MSCSSLNNQSRMSGHVIRPERNRVGGFSGFYTARGLSKNAYGLARHRCKFVKIRVIWGTMKARQSLEPTIRRTGLGVQGSPASFSLSDQTFCEQLEHRGYLYFAQAIQGQSNRVVPPKCFTEGRHGTP